LEPVFAKRTGFEDIVSDFAPQVENQKRFAREMQSAIFTGMFRGNGIMYDGMIEALSRATDRLEKGEQPIS
jgi:hypothetical protein